MRRLAAIVIVVAVMMVMLSLEHDRRCAVVPMPMLVTDVNSDAADADLNAFRDDRWFGAVVQRTGKYWCRQQRNKKKSK